MRAAIIILGMLVVGHGDKLIIKEFEVPEMIPVLVTGEKICKRDLPYTLQYIEFKEYVKNVLPNEWNPTWEEESLKAGAVAIKNYAWSKIISGSAIWDCNWSQVYDPSRRTDRTDRAVEESWDWWIVDENGDPLRTYYNVNAEGCATQPPNCMSQFNSQRFAELGNWDFNRILQFYYDGMLVRNDKKENNGIDFPYVTQYTEDASFANDCGSATIKMVAQYYGIAETRSLDEIHWDMMEGDYPSNYVNIAVYMVNTYGLDVEVITTHKALKDALEELEFDVSEIEVVEAIPFDRPVIWIYAVTPHWVVRYRGYNYDPWNGIYPFEKTAELRNLYRPDLGLGIVVVPKGKGVQYEEDS